MGKTELRRRALRAAAAVTMTMSLLGCGGSVDRNDPSDDGSEDPGSDTVAQDDTPPPAPTGRPASPATSSSSGTPWGLDAGLADDAEEPIHCEMGQTAEEYQKFVECCDAVNWDSEAGCFAWGPPVPPAMGTRRA